MTTRYEKFAGFSENARPHLANSALYKWGSMVVALVAMFAMTPFIIQHVGKYGYGLWTISVSLVGYYGILNLGVTSAVSRFVSVSLGKRDLVALNQVFNTAFLMFVCTGCLVAIAIQPLAPWLSGLFDAQNAQLEYLVRMIGLSVAISFPASVMISLIIAHECYKLQSIVAVINTVTRTALTLYFLANGHGIEGLANAFIITSLVDFALNALIIIVYLPWVRVAPGSYRFAVLKEMVAFGIPTMVMSIAVLLRTELDSVVIGGMIGIEEVAVYSIAALIIKNLFSMINGGLGVLTPRYSRLVGAGEDVTGLFSAGLFYAATLAFGSGGIVYLFGAKFIHLWLGDGFDDSLPILWLLMGCYIVTLMQIPGYNLLMALNRHKVFAAITLAEGVANLLISVALAPRFGLMGVALGTAVPMLFVKIAIQPYFVIKAAHFSASNYLLPMSIPAAIGVTFIVAGFVLDVPSHLNDFGWMAFVGAVTGFGAIYLTSVVGFTFLLQRSFLRLGPGGRGAALEAPT